MVFTHEAEKFETGVQYQIDEVMALSDDLSDTLVGDMKIGQKIVVSTLGEGVEDFYIVEKLPDDWYVCIPYYEMLDDGFTRGYKELKSVEIKVHVTPAVLRMAIETPGFTRTSNMKPCKIRVRDVLDFAREDCHLRNLSEFTKMNFSLKVTRY